MKQQTSPTHNLRALLQKKGLSSLELAKKIGTSAPHMSRLINGQSPLNDKWILKISAALKVPTRQIVGVNFGKKLIDRCDDTLLGSIMGWLIEASNLYKVKLSSQQLTKLTSLIYKEAMETPLTFTETRYQAYMAVRVKLLLGIKA